MPRLTRDAAAAASTVARRVSAKQRLHQPRCVRISRITRNSSLSILISVVVLVRVVRIVVFFSITMPLRWRQFVAADFRVAVESARNFAKEHSDRSFGPL